MKKLSKKFGKKINLASRGINLFVLIFVILLSFFLGQGIDVFKRASLGSPLLKLEKGEVITSKELYSLLPDEELVLINVHTPYEGEIKGTDTFIDYDMLMANKVKLPQDKDAKIVLYCKTGNMSTQALYTLKNLGYQNVSHLKGGMDEWVDEGLPLIDLSNISDRVIPAEGVELSFSFGDLPARLVDLGVIDKDKFVKATGPRSEEIKLLEEGSSMPIIITSDNSRFVVNVLWAIGLAQESLAYTEGPMGQEYKDKAGSFASTGGWSLSEGDAVGHLGAHNLLNLDSKDQERIAEIAKNIYRPCCGNHTFFPDCNHGMAALAAIELMVSNGISDEEIYKNILVLNSYWFSDTYIKMATYFERQGTNWEAVDAKLALSEEYSSGKGAADLNKKVGPLPFGSSQGGGSCGA